VAEEDDIAAVEAEAEKLFRELDDIVDGHSLAAIGGAAVNILAAAFIRCEIPKELADSYVETIAADVRAAIMMNQPPEGRA